MFGGGPESGDPPIERATGSEQPLSRAIDRSDPIACLASIRRLAGAACAVVVSHEHGSEAELLFRSPTSSDRVLPLAAINAALGPAAAHQQALWTDGEDSFWLVAMDPQHGASRWLLLVFHRLDASAREPVRQTAPHLAAMMSAVLCACAERDRLRAAERSMAAVLDQHDCGIVILRRDHRVLFRNAAAARIFEDGLLLETHRGSLRPPLYRDAVRFQTALDCLLSDTSPASAGSRPTSMIMLLRGRDAERAMIVVLAPAVAGSNGQVADAEAAVVVYLMRPDQSATRGLEQICRLHGLSPVETRLVGHLVAGAALNDAAVEMHIKPDTAPTSSKCSTRPTRIVKPAWCGS